MRYAEKMKKITALFLVIVLGSIILGTVITSAAEQVSYQVSVYSAGKEGLPLKVKPDLSAARYSRIPENTSLTIDQIENGWGHTTYNGISGWVALRYTRITSSYTAKVPQAGYIEAAYYIVNGTQGEGLELRVEPSVHSSTFGPVPDGTKLKVLAIDQDWAYTSYNGNYGWVNLTYLRKSSEKPVSSEVQVRVYDTDGEGLSLKAAADLSATRYLTIPENTTLILDEITKSGWGHTIYGGYSGWVSLRYTMITGNYEAEIPTSGSINPSWYTVYNTEGEGLELRTRPDVESSTFGPIPDGTILQVTAINDDWAYTLYNGHHGWANLTYLKKMAN